MRNAARRWADERTRLIMRLKNERHGRRQQAQQIGALQSFQDNFGDVDDNYDRLDPRVTKDRDLSRLGF